MKTSSFTTLLALTFLSLFVAPSNAKGMGMGMSMKMGMSMGNSNKGHPNGSASPPTASPPVSGPQTCPQTCASIVEKPFIQCSFVNCVGLFECQNLPRAPGFKSQARCSQFCVSFQALSCPQGFTTTSSPFSRCIAARCT